MTLIQQISTLKQISIMLEAGISIDTILREFNLPVYDDIHRSISSGLSLSEAMQKHKLIFSNLTISMIKLGESTGRLPEAIAKLVQILELTSNNKKMVKKAIRMPIITIVTLFVAFVSLMIFMVPTFADIFMKYELELPFFTELMIIIEQFIRYHGETILVLSILIIGLIYYQYRNSHIVRAKLDEFMVSRYFYIVNHIIFKSNMYRYNLVLYEMLRAGVDIDKALDRALDIVDNYYMKDRLSKVKGNINKGQSLYVAMKSTGLYGAVSIQFIKAGESSGKLDLMLKEVSELYYVEFTEIIDNISAYIEPILTFVIATLILFFALGILMPMWNLTSLTRSGL